MSASTVNSAELGRGQSCDSKIGLDPDIALQIADANEQPGALPWRGP